jgi:hypothetical protein
LEALNALFEEELADSLNSFAQSTNEADGAMLEEAKRGLILREKIGNRAEKNRENENWKAESESLESNQKFGESLGARDSNAMAAVDAMQDAPALSLAEAAKYVQFQEIRNRNDVLDILSKHLGTFHDGTVEKSVIIKIGSNVLDHLISNGVVANLSDTQVRLNSNLNPKEGVVKEIGSSQLWSDLLQFRIAKIELTAMLVASQKGCGYNGILTPIGALAVSAGLDSSSDDPYAISPAIVQSRNIVGSSGVVSSSGVVLLSDRTEPARTEPAWIGSSSCMSAMNPSAQMPS